MTTEIKVRLSTIDRFSKSAKFKTLKGARNFATKYVGNHPEISYTFGYAVSSYSDAKVTISGTLDDKPVKWSDIFPSPEALEAETAPAPEPEPEPELVKPALPTDAEHFADALKDDGICF